MFVVLLRFSDNKPLAGEYMAGHNDWIRQGITDGVFILVGSIEPGQGGAIFAHNISMDELQQRVKEDPFVAHNVVTSEVIEITPKKADDRLGFLLD